MMHDIFLSYSRKDAKIMERVKKSFIDAGFGIWTDEGIKPGTSSWKKAIDNAITNAKALVCISSPDSKQSKWVQAELDQAELYEKEVYLILARGKPAQSIPFGYAAHQWTDIRDTDDYEKEIGKLITTIQADWNLLELPTITNLGSVSDSFEWIMIPSGEVTLQEGGYIPKGGQIFAVEEFHIAKYPITYAQYAKYVETGGKKPRYWDNAKFNQPLQPVVGITWGDAIAYCEWLSKQVDYTVMLPTEQQWQRAAQGDDEYVYPWSNSWDASRCQNSVDSKANGTSIVTKYEGEGDSPFGVVDMSGNVWEWCLTEYETGSNNTDGISVRVLRGGSWYIVNADILRATFRDGGNPVGRYDGRGFRVVRSYT